MVRRLIAVMTFATGMSIAAVMLATPALAKGPSQARITGPGLIHAIIVTGGGEPGQPGKLASLAERTDFFTVLFGAFGNMPAPVRLRTAPPRASLGPRYTVIYTVPGVPPQGSEQFGRIRQELYPRAADGPVIYTPPGQRGFGQPLQVTGWLRGDPHLTSTLARLGVPPTAAKQTARSPRISAGAHPAPAHQAGSRTIAWLIASAAAIATVALAGTALWLRRRTPGDLRDSGPVTSGSAAKSG
jgi:hypothetical protein